MVSASYTCNICKTHGFKSKASVRSHADRVHKIKCKICRKVFYRPNNLITHVKYVHHGVGWNPPQIGAGVVGEADFSGKNFKAFKTKTRQTQIGLTENSYTFKFDNLEDSGVNDTLVSQIDYLKQILHAVIKKIKSQLSEADSVQFILYTNPNNIKSTFSTPFLRKNDFNYSNITNRVSELLNSNETFRVDNEMVIDFKIVKATGGTLLSMKKASNVVQLLQRKNSVLLNKCRDNLCLARALLLAYYHYRVTKKTATQKMWTRIKQKDSPFLKMRAEMLQMAGGMSPNTQVALKDVSKFDKCFKKFQINVHRLDCGKLKKIHSGKNNKTDSLNVFYHDNHFYPIVNFKAFIGVAYICEYCDFATSNQLFHHVCKAKCFFCHGARNHPCYLTDSASIESEVYTCHDCNQDFYSKICLAQHRVKVYSHKTKSVCDIFGRCGKCNNVHNLDNDCTNVGYCEHCKTRKFKNHDCYINPHPPTEKFKKYLVYDIESRLETSKKQDVCIHTEHIPNLVCSRLLCDACLTDLFCTKCAHCQFETFKGDFCVKNFIRYVSGLENVAVIGHNSSRYDHIFLLGEIVQNIANIPVTIIPCGNSLLSMTLGSNVVFRDSNLFFKSPLAKLPTFFGFVNEPLRIRTQDGRVTEQHEKKRFTKGMYPYSFNKKANYGYKGQLPPIEYYSIQNMDSTEKNIFFSWYAGMVRNNTEFEFWPDLINYCENDVNLLAHSLNIYRKSNMQYKIEPFDSVSVAQLTFSIFTNNFLQRDQIMRESERHGNTSIKANAWLHYYETTSGLTLVREYKLPNTNYRVDGYSSVHNRVFEFLGDWYHGHNIHYSPTDILCGGKSARTLYNNTLERISVITKLGYSVTTMWECDFDKLVKEKPEVFRYSPETLTIRSALYGGRCEVFSVYNDYVQQNKYGRSVDIVSLYPSCMVDDEYPVGEPEFIDMNDIPRPFNLNDYFGIISCEVTAPEKLYIPVLPHKTKAGKLTFPLCTECVENKITICTHFNQRCRNLIGCWTSVELELAVSEGYIIQQVYQIYHYKERTRSLFKAFILHMLKGKLEASGYPESVTDESDKIIYIQMVKTKTGIDLDPKNIKYNAAVRNYYKLKLNSLWGKLAQNPHKKTHTEIVRDCQKLMQFNDQILDKKIVVNNMYILPNANASEEESVVLVDYQKSPHHVTVPWCSNPSIASFVTSHARKKIYASLKTIGKSLSYCDTDSAYYSENSNEITSQLDIGENLGQMKNELVPGNYITMQICLAPKTYGYTTKLAGKDGRFQVVKNKGFKNEITEKINVDSFINLFRDKTATISVENPNFFLRNRRDCTVYMKKLSKRFNYNYDKRIVLNDTDTIPWGYRL